MRQTSPRWRTPRARANRQVLVAENYFYKPLAVLLRDTIARGDFGDLAFIQLMR